jgi:ribosome recycling factor
MELQQILPHVNEKIKFTIEHYIVELKKVRTGRAHTGFLDHITIDYYGNSTPIPQVAVLSLADSQTLTVKPYEKNLIPAIEKAITEANLGVNGVTQGEMILVAMPRLTEERRKELVKQIKKMAEEVKIAVRNIRRDGNHATETLLKAKTISEDDDKRTQHQIQLVIDKAILQIDDITKSKEQELMTI